MSAIFPFLGDSNPYVPNFTLFLSPVFFPKRTKRKYWMKSTKGRFRNGRKKHNRK